MDSVFHTFSYCASGGVWPTESSQTGKAAFVREWLNQAVWIASRNICFATWPQNPAQPGRRLEITF